MSEDMKTPARNDAPGPGKACHAIAADLPSVSSGTSKGHGAGTAYTVTPDAGEALHIVVSGRVRWALDALRAAGERGCSPITRPAPRWAAYVHKLRALGVVIDTLHEPHAGDFPGTHARYVLRSRVVPVGAGGEA